LTAAVSRVDSVSLKTVSNCDEWQRRNREIERFEWCFFINLAAIVFSLGVSDRQRAPRRGFIVGFSGIVGSKNCAPETKAM